MTVVALTACENVAVIGGPVGLFDGATSAAPSDGDVEVMASVVGGAAPAVVKLQLNGADSGTPSDARIAVLSVAV